MWPGRLNDDEVTAGSARERSVAARSAAEMPVVVPSARSTVIVKAVPCDSVFSRALTIG